MGLARAIPKPPAKVDRLALSQALDYFISLMEGSGWSPKTVKVYRAAVKDFMDVVGEGRRVSDITVEDYIKWLSYISRRVREGSMSKSTAHYYSIMVRRFLKWAGIRGDMPAYGRKDRGFKGSLRWVDIEMLLNAAHDKLDLLIVAILAETGLRVSEFLSIRIRDIDFSQGSLRVVGKYGKERIVFLGPISMSIIAEYLRENPPTSPDERLVKISYQAVYKRLKRLALRAGIDPKLVRPHILRHTFATEALRRGMSLPALQRILGHSDIKVTQLYLHLTVDDIRAEYMNVFTTRHGNAQTPPQNWGIQGQTSYPPTLQNPYMPYIRPSHGTAPAPQHGVYTLNAIHYNNPASIRQRRERHASP